IRFLTLDFMDHCVGETADRPPSERLTVADYTAVALKQPGLGLRDWIFAVPPFRDAPDQDEAYLAYLRAQKSDEEEVAKAGLMRALVPAFLTRCVETILASEPRVAIFTVTPPFGEAVPALVLARMLKARSPALPIVFFGGDCDGPMGAALH